MKSFWNQLPRPVATRGDSTQGNPFFVLAPLANVTDAAFRRLIAKHSKPAGPHVMYTEFVSADGLILAHEEGKAKLMRDLIFTDAERPVVAQFFTSKPEMMERAAALAAELGFDGVDINMGCPDQTIEKQGAGAKLILNPKLAVELIAAAKRGSNGLSVSVKTRLGYNKDILEEWLPALLAAEPAAITIHARTRKEMSKVAAHWDRIKRAVEIRNELNSSTLIIGNGDVADLNDARQKAAESGCDGVMLGRAIFGSPWLFDESKHPSIEERLRAAVEHTKLFEELLGDIKSFAIMKKHFKAYVEASPVRLRPRGFDGAKELRMQLMECESAAEVAEVVERFLERCTAAAEVIQPL